MRDSLLSKKTALGIRWREVSWMIVARVACLAMGVALLAAPTTAEAASDTGPPVVHLNGGVVFARGSVLSESTGNAWLPAKVTWNATDDVGIVNQFLHWEVFDANTWTVATGDVNAPNTREVTTPYYPNGLLRFRVDAYDNAAKQGTSETAYFGSLVQSEEFTASSGWYSVPCRLCFSRGASLRTTTPGASLTYTFTGQSIALIGDFARGAARNFTVSINGVQQGGVRSEHGTPRRMAVVYQKRFPTNATRTLKVVATSGQIDIDALVVQVGSCPC